MTSRLLFLILSSICSLPSQAINMVTAPTYISGELTATCTATVVPIVFDSMPLGVGQTETKAVTWTVDCTAPTLVTIIPYITGIALSGNTFNITADGGGQIKTELLFEGRSFDASGVPINHPGGILSFQVSAKITPLSTIAAKFKQLISATISFI